MSRAACKLFHRVCHKNNGFRAACRLFHRVCHQHNMSRIACRLFHRACHQHIMFRAACSLFHSLPQIHVCDSMSQHDVRFTESVTNITRLGLQAACFTVCHKPMSGTACNSTMLVSQSLPPTRRVPRTCSEECRAVSNTTEYLQPHSNPSSTMTTSPQFVGKTTP